MSNKDAINITNKKSVVMIISKYEGVGGSDVVIKNLCIGLNALGHKTAIGAFSFKQEPPIGTEKIILKRFSSIDSNPRIKEYDIIHSHQTMINYNAISTTKPIIFHYHGAATLFQELNLKISIFLLKNKIKKILTVSKTGVNQLSKIIDKNDIQIIHNGVFIEKYNTTLPRSYNKGNPQLLFVGNLYQKKNVRIIVNAIPKILKKFPNTQLQIVGYGEEFENLKKQIEQQNLHNVIELVGRVSEEELRLRYASSDVYVSASSFEVHPVPLMEAMACGIPLLVSDIEPHRDVIEESKAGMLFEPENINDLALKLEKIIENKEKFSLEGRKFAEKFDWSNIAKEISEVYERL